MLMSRHTLRTLLVLSVLVLCMGCPNSPGDDTTEVVPTTNEVHVAFAGGGWRAHTGHSGWTVALLNKGNRTLSDAFANVGTISSNSGGSWFNTMLAYSGDFVSKIEAPDAVDTWGTTGWLGQQQALFDEAPCHDSHEDAFDLCVAEYYSSQGATHWASVVEGLVFKDYSLGDITLSGTRQSWAANKSLLLAATMLTTNTVLNGSTLGDKNYYQACLAPTTPVFGGYDRSSCSGGAIPDVTPVTFSSLPGGSSLTSPPFFKATEKGTNAAVFNMAYTQNTNDEPDTASTIIANPLATDKVPVMIAAAASSAAVGFEASDNVSGEWEASWLADDEALSFKLTGSTVEFADASGLSVSDLAAQKFVRIADGGPVDNSGVAQLVSFLQQNNQDEGFNIVAFDNVQLLYVAPSDTSVKAGPDISSLFGLGICPGNKFCSGLNCDGTCVSIPNLQIFEQDSMLNTSVTWEAVRDSANLVQQLIYTKYSVKTIDNSTFGVSKGSTGTLHAFTCVWSNADTAPQNRKNEKDGDFKAYNQMFDYINSGLQENGAEGLKYLEAALRLD